MFFSWEQVDKAQVLTLLKQLEILFSNPDTWCCWPVSIDSFNQETKPTDESAVKWSLMGASEMFCKQSYTEPLSGFVDCAARDYLNHLSNDELIHGRLTQVDELNLIKTAIASLEKR